jgi:hypothetical protein
MTALVRGVIAASSRAGSRQHVSGSMSTKTGVAPTKAIASVSAKNVWATVTTSSPGPMPAARKARIRASVPELSPIACATWQ